jgi:hypothetical protein
MPINENVEKSVSPEIMVQSSKAIVEKIWTLDSAKK